MGNQSNTPILAVLLLAVGAIFLLGVTGFIIAIVSNNTANDLEDRVDDIEMIALGVLPAWGSDDCFVDSVCLGTCNTSSDCVNITASALGTAVSTSCTAETCVYIFGNVGGAIPYNAIAEDLCQGITEHSLTPCLASAAVPDAGAATTSACQVVFGCNSVAYNNMQ